MAAEVFASVFPAPSKQDVQHEQTRQQFTRDTRPAVLKALAHPDSYTALENVVRVLKDRRFVDHGVVAFGLPLPRITDNLLQVLQKHGRIILGIHDESYETTASTTADAQALFVYRTHYANCESMELVQELDGDLPEPQHVQTSRLSLFQLLQGLQDVGLGGAEAQKTLALAVDSLMTQFVSWAYSDAFTEVSEVLAHLKFWVENILARFVVQVLNLLSSHGQGGSMLSPITFADVQKWQDMAVTRLGKLRTDELFDIIVNWDSTKSGIDDLKQYTVNPATRTYVTSNFITILSYRLLQPGASTVEILQVYISIIRAFRHLDPKGVLLDRVARPIRGYLRTRDDTVRIVVNGILAEVDPEGNPTTPDPTVLAELAVELKLRSLSDSEEQDLDWDNMDWTADPIDAAPDYRKSKSTDVVGSLISLFDSKEVFVKELQTALADGLLQKKANYDQEISVLEHLKIRFGDAALQACEVMLRDVLDSRRTDSVIRNDSNIYLKPVQVRHDMPRSVGTEQLPQTPAQPIQGAVVPSLDPSSATASRFDVARLSSPPKLDHNLPLSTVTNTQIHAKVLSRLFWPHQTLDPPDDPDSYDDTSAFNIPPPIASLQDTYSRGFESLKQSRKLTWLNNLGYVTVELDLEDRIFQADDITPMQASVIYTFQDNIPSSSQPVTKTVAQLSTALRMPTSFILSACSFWVSKQILTSTPSTPAGSSYTVLERLPTATTTSPSQQTSASKYSAIAQPTTQPEPSTPTISSRSAIPPTKAALYNQFIISMLTNQGPMPLQRIGMMLGMVVPGGWGYGNEELRELLVGLGREGKVEMAGGGVWKVVKD